MSTSPIDLSDPNTILTAALALPDEKRVEIADGLLASLRPPGAMSLDDPDSVAELKRRMSETDAPTIDGDEAMRRLWQSQREREGK